MASGVSYSIDIDATPLSAALNRAIHAGEDLTPLLRASGELERETIDKRFDTGRGPGGVAWVPSGRVRAQAVPKPYKRANRNMYGPRKTSGKTLIDKGNLVGSIAFDVRPNEVEIGSAANARGDVRKYAAVHQFGATIEAKGGGYLMFIGADGAFVRTKSATIPARPYVGFDSQGVAAHEDLWTRMLQDEIDG